MGRTIILVLVLISNPTNAFCLSLGQPVDYDPTVCGYSDQIYTSDALLMQSPKAPTLFRLMVSRYVAMVQAARAYRCTGTVTVGFDGHHYLQTGRSDDPGIMELMPTLSRLLSMPLPKTYDLTILLIIGLGMVIGYFGFLKLYQSAESRWIGSLAFAGMGLAQTRVADEYVFQIFPLIAGIPWLLHFALTKRNSALTAASTLLAFCCSCCSLVRTGTIVICMTFLVAMFLLRHRSQKCLLSIVLCVLACIPASLFERFLVRSRNVALAKVGQSASAQDSRPLWHTLYIGLGFIPNTEVPEYKDEVARDKVRSLDPTAAYTSSQYEAILRHEVWGIFKHKPFLLVRIFAAKAAIIIVLGLVILFPARNLVFSEKEVFWADGAFLLAIGMSAMNSIVAIPRLSYLLTFICLALMYTSFKVCRERSQVRWNHPASA